MTEFATEYLKGIFYWAKVFKAVDNYNRDGKEWTFNFIPEEESIDVLKKHRLLDRLKEANDSVPGDYLVLKKPEFDKKGNKNKPIIVKTADNQDWDVDTNGLIGNGSKGYIKVTIADFGRGLKKAIWTNAIRIDEHVPHEGGTQSNDPFAGIPVASSPDKKNSKAKARQVSAEDLDDFADDDLPFDL